MPGEFDGLPATRPATQPAASVSDRWWRSLGDPELDSLIGRAISANFDLQIALTRVQEARMQEAAVTGGALPMLDFSGGAGRGSGTNSTKGRVEGPLNAGTNTTGLREITQVYGFDAGWEIDLWGQYRREIEAARDDAQATAELRNGVLITVAADVARAYSDLRDEQWRLSILKDNIANQQQTMNIVQDKVRLGMVNDLDLQLARRQLAVLQAQIAPLELEIDTSQNRLAVLLGKFPQEMKAELSAPGNLPTPPPAIAAGLPITLLRRRPDIRHAERELAAYTARVGVAVADLYPHVAITSGIGLQGQGLGRQPSTNFLDWSVGPTAEWPLLDFGTLDAQIQLADLQTHEALVNYKRTIVLAVEDVDNAIASFSASHARLTSLAVALDASKKAVTLAQQRYERGIIDFLNVADAERQLYELQDQYASAEEDVTLGAIDVYEALGGGWQQYQALPPIRQPQPAVVAAVREAIAPTDPEK
jgi:NodT family efflux transporter outer membrane factor (OMF) lipoprotein